MEKILRSKVSSEIGNACKEAAKGVGSKVEGKHAMPERSEAGELCGASSSRLPLPEDCVHGFSQTHLIQTLRCASLHAHVFLQEPAHARKA